MDKVLKHNSSKLCFDQ